MAQDPTTLPRGSMSDRYTFGFEPSLLLRMEEPVLPDAK
jgi:hypothetical protein